MGDIELTIASPPDRERVVAEGFLNGEQLFELSNEPSRHFILEIYPRTEGEPWRMSAEQFISALREAQEKLDYPGARGEP